MDDIRTRRSFAPATLALALLASSARSDDRTPLPRIPDGWKIELAAKAPDIAYPTAIVVAPGGTVYLGQDPMDMPGPPTQPIDSVVAIRDGKVSTFADGLWAVMGLEWVDGALIVVHPPFLSAFRDGDRDGKAESRVDLVTGLGPKLPGFSGINDHVASGVRLGMDGFLYVAVGDKGIPRAVGRDGKAIQLRGGGVIRVRPDGTDLEVVSTGERNPLSVALTDSDEIFTYGNDDDSKAWPNSLTHHVVGGHYGYPYEFRAAPWRSLPVVAGQLGGAGAQGICLGDDGYPAEYRGNLLFCEWGQQAVDRYVVQKSGGTYRVAKKSVFARKGDVSDFRPFSIAAGVDRKSLYLVDWAYAGWLSDGPKVGRLYRLSCEAPDATPLTPAPADDMAALGHPARSIRLTAQRRISARGADAVAPLSTVLATAGPVEGRRHALWALDAIGSAAARQAIRPRLADADAEIRLQAARSSGIRADRAAATALASLLRDPDASVRREAAIALGKIADPSTAPALLASLAEQDAFAAWSIRGAIRRVGGVDAGALRAALVDPRRRDDALTLVDAWWSVPAVEALAGAIMQSGDPAWKARAVAALGGLYRKYPPWKGDWFGTNPLAGRFPERTEAWDPRGMSAALRGLASALDADDSRVRLAALGGLRGVGKDATPLIRGRLAVESDGAVLVALAEVAGAAADAGSVPTLATLARDAARPAAVRVSALDALANMVGPAALKARMRTAFDDAAPPAVQARALEALGKQRVIPPNDLAGFLGHASAEVRTAALLALAPRGVALPAGVRAAIVDRLGDDSPEARRAATEVVAYLALREAVPKLIEMAAAPADRAEARRALAAVPDPRAAKVYLESLDDRDPRIRRGAEEALASLREAAAADLDAAARSGGLSATAALAVERILSKFRPVVDWKVIGPFARTIGPVFVGAPSIDFARAHAGVEGRPIRWEPRKAEDAATGRVALDDLKGEAGDRGGFGYDASGSPDLVAFGYAEVVSDRDRSALLLAGSSGSLIVTLNERVVLDASHPGGRAFASDSDAIRVALKAGRNRLLVRARQGIGPWCVSVQVSETSAVASAAAARPAANLERLRAFAANNPGDARAGAAIFSDPKGIGCVKCHAAGGRAGGDVGPDLTGLASKYDKAEVIRSVLEPSARIATGYQPAVVALRDGSIRTGLVRSESEGSLELVDGEAKATRIPKSEIEVRKVGDASTMPSGLVDTLTPVEFADLISYLMGLKAADGPRPTAVH